MEFFIVGFDALQQEEEALKQELLISEFSGEGSVVGLSVLISSRMLSSVVCMSKWIFVTIISRAFMRSTQKSKSQGIFNLIKPSIKVFLIQVLFLGVTIQFCILSTSLYLLELRKGCCCFESYCWKLETRILIHIRIF